VITLNLLFKTKKHITYCFALIGFVFVVSSCKSKKGVKTSKQQTIKEKSVSNANLDEARVGIIYVNACLERKKGNLQEALKLFEECRSINPKEPAVRYELGTIYKLLGANTQALLNARYCAESDPKNEWYQLLLIDCYNATKQYSQAIKVRETLIKNFPAKNEFKEDLAIEYAIMGQYDKSFKIYEELERTYGINEQITLNKVKLLKSQKKYKEVEVELKKLSATNTNEPRYYAYLAEFYQETNDPEKAKEMYDKIVSVDPGNPDVYLALHNYYSAKGNDVKAFEYLKKAFINPDLDVETKTNILASFYKRSEGNDRAAYSQGYELAKIMLEVHPEAPESNALYADFLRLDGKLKEASKYYYKAALNERRDFRVWDNLLYTDYELLQYDSLERHSVMAIEIFPSLSLNYKYNGIANIELKNYNKATQSLKDGLEFVNDNSQKIDFFSLMGDAFFYLKQYEKADNAFDEALKINADNTYVLNNYAYYLSLRGTDLDKAERLSKRGNELKPNDRNYQDTFGWILFQQKKYTEAEIWLSKAANSGPKSATILEHYGDVLFKLNKSAEALKQWEAAKQSGGDSEILRNKIKNKKMNE
jgi:tetratricopeptide (TPR) repeat protein